MELESKRARRRRLTETVCLRRHCSYIRINAPWWDPTVESPWCHRTPHRWSKSRSQSCGCRKTTHGAPRRDKGMCKSGRHRIYRWRARVQELVWLVVRGHWDPDEDKVALLTHPGGVWS